MIKDNDMNTVISTAALIPWQDLEPWARTLRRHSPWTHNVLLADPVEHYRELEKYGIKVIDAMLLDGGRANICKSRWREIALYLEHGDVVEGYVLCTDARDVVFTGNPFSFMALPGEPIRVPSEGIQFGDEQWNWTALNEAFPTLAESMRHETVVCAGVVCGPRDKMLDLAWALYFKSPRGWLDQATLNVMVRRPGYFKSNDRLFVPQEFEVVPNSAGWVAQCGVALAPRLRDLWPKMTEPRPVVQFGMPTTPATGARYAICHQYDRSPDTAGLRYI